MDDDPEEATQQQVESRQNHAAEMLRQAAEAANPSFGILQGQCLEQTAVGEVDEREHHRASSRGGMEPALLPEEAAAHGGCQDLRTPHVAENEYGAVPPNGTNETSTHRLAGETSVGPVSVVVRVPVARLRHDELELPDTLEVRPHRDGRLGPAQDAARHEHLSIAPHLELDRAAIADLLVDAHVREEQRTRLSEFDHDTRGSVGADSPIEPPEPERNRVAVVR